MGILRHLAENQTPGGRSDVLWACVTVALSAAVSIGYGVIAVKWFFQSKLSKSADAGAALARLRGIVLCCGICGVVFFLNDMTWAVWRLYDGFLLLLACHTWRFAFRIRGLSFVNERLARLDELERTAAKYREIAELLPHIVWTATADGRVDFSNRLWTDYGGEGRTWLDATHPDERPEVAAWWAESVSARKPAGREIRLEGPDGYRTFVLKATPIVHGNAVKWLGACADIEDQKRLTAEREAQAKQKAFFLNALSHDLRAPLNNVALNAHLLKLSARDETQVETTRTIVENAIAAGDLVTRLLDFAKAGEERNAADPVSLAEVLDETRRRFLPSAERKGLYLRVRPDDDVRGVTDRHKLERIVSNLVDNAVKYTERGGVELSVAAVAGKMYVRVTDTGGGVPEASAAYLFDEFYQVDNHERDRTKGFGLGLAICRALARKLGGDVRLVRTGPDGSCFEAAVKAEGVGGRGRPDGEEGDRADSPPAGSRRDRGGNDRPGDGPALGAA